MNTALRHDHWASRVAIALVVLAVLSTLACAPGGLLRREEAGPAPTSTLAPPASPTPLPTASPTPLPGGGKGGTDEGAASAEGMDLVPCPPSGSTMLLKFSAWMRITHDQAQITHTLEDGVLNLALRGEGASSSIEGVGAAPIPYTMSGTMGPCSLEGGGQMVPSAYGFCEDGVVYLIIAEDWGAYQGTLYLDRGFSSEGAGYTTMRPFQAGEGEHIWTLFYDYTGPVQ